MTLTADAVGPVARGHPWVYADGVRSRPPVGALVTLLDPRGRPVAFGLSDEGDVAVRVLGRTPDTLPRLLSARIGRAAAARVTCLPPDTDAARLVNGAGDGLPGLVVDRYGPVAVVRIYGACWEPHLALIVAALAEVEAVETIVRRLGVRRVDGAEGAEVLTGPAPVEPLVVHEAGLRFLARPLTGQKTGLFLDQREHRRFVGALARGATVLNLFGYTGGFSVFAAAGGAQQTTTVDIAEPALADARENFRLNGLDPAAHRFEAADAFHFEPSERYGLVVSDPPSLAHGRQSDAAARRAYRDLASHTGALVAPGGLLATASCTARLSWERWEEAVREGLRRGGRWSWIWRAAEPPDHPVALDHPEGRYLKFAALRKSG